MINFLIGIFIGFFVASYGVVEIAKVLDNQVQTIKSVKITTEK